MVSVKNPDLKYGLWYQDESEDWITISDDDDIQLAIEFAMKYCQGSLRLIVKPIESSNDSDVKSKVASSKATKSTKATKTSKA